ncbi:hypothetical protein niasHS_003204 [Heterodera schachtii]|uniref:Uncharacterized protein n=1 Tax=Heterodera schachtii TaxID=97005 RepID=A0ABD2KFT0_HETSC
MVFPTFLLLPLFALLLSECRGIELVLRNNSSLDKLNISLSNASLNGKKILVKLDNGSFRPIFAGTSLDRPYFLSVLLRYIGSTTVFEYCKTRTGLPNEYFVISDGDDDQVKMDCLQMFNKSAKSKDPPKNRKLVIKQLVNLPKMEIQWAKDNKFCKTVEQGIP